jgi:A/G-specific adenine glycosylase
MTFAARLIGWRRRHGRRGLPWQGTRDPYRIWLSEVMLQQTQVATVIPYYQRFLARYPDVRALARASEDEVLRLWSGLGYYARGRNLHKAARQIVASGFPRTSVEIQKLAGVGRSTAAAIAAFAFGERAAILDGNVKRVLARCYGIASEKALWARAEALVPETRIEDYTQALMDLGATVCVRRKPRCGECPVAAQCVARREGRIEALPAPRRRRVLPQKHTRWLVLRRQGEVLLERRPAPGIWGGLWCFPEHAGRVTREMKKLAPIDHGFTHFRLRIQPLVQEVRAARRGGIWLGIEEAMAAAVPAPVRTLLGRLRAEGR